MALLEQDVQFREHVYAQHIKMNVMQADTVESGVVDKSEEEPIVLSNARKYTLLALVSNTISQWVHS